MDDYSGGSIHHNGHIPGALVSGLSFDIAFEHETGMPLKTLEEWMVRLETKIDTDRREQQTFREEARAQLAVISRGYDKRFSDHDQDIADLMQRVVGGKGEKGLIRDMDDAKGQITENEARLDRYSYYFAAVLSYLAAVSIAIGSWALGLIGKH